MLRSVKGRTLALNTDGIFLECWTVVGDTKKTADIFIRGGFSNEGLSGAVAQKWVRTHTILSLSDSRVRELLLDATRITHHTNEMATFFRDKTNLPEIC